MLKWPFKDYVLYIKYVHYCWYFLCNDMLIFSPERQFFSVIICRSMTCQFCLQNISRCCLCVHEHNVRYCVQKHKAAVSFLQRHDVLVLCPEA